MCVCITESLCCTPETLQINQTSILKSFLKSKNNNNNKNKQTHQKNPKTKRKKQKLY